MYNKIILVGNLTRDIELRYTQSGSAIANTSIATSRKFTVNGEKREEVCFVDITFFGRSAEVANQYLRKGSKILVDGRLKFDQWVDQQGGKRSKHGVVVETMQMLDSREYTQPGANSTPPQQQEQHNGIPVERTNTSETPRYQETQKVPQEYLPKQQSSHTSYQEKPQQQAKMPENTLPEIDIDEDEIPF